MAKHNYGKKNATRRSSGLSGQLVLILCAFIVGYYCSNMDFSKLSHWLKTTVLAEQQPQLIAKPREQQANLPKPKFEFYTLLANGQSAVDTSKPAVTQASSNVQSALNVQPAANNVQISSANQGATPAKNNTVTPIDLTVTQKLPLHAPLTAALETKASNPVVMPKDTYLIQVGSFKNLHEAERMKAALILKGFEVRVVAVSQQRMNWYRVNIGPFASRSQALKAQSEFARSEHITGMIRKMDA
jgi:cell division protein FtsN